MDSKLIPAAESAETASWEGAAVEVASRAGADAALLEVANVSIVAAAAAAEAAAVVVKGDLMLSPADELRFITGCMDTAGALTIQFGHVACVGGCSGCGNGADFCNGDDVLIAGGRTTNE